MSRKFLVAHRSSLIAMLFVVLTITSAAGLNRNSIRDFLYGITGEESAEHQVRGLANWLTGITRPQPQTDDFVPIAYNGVNPFGVNTFLNQEVEESKRARQLDLIRDAGFKWIRQEFPWEDIEIHAKGDFSDRRNATVVSAWDKYDGIVHMASERGIQIIARLSTPPKWSRADQAALATTPPDNLNDYGDFVAAVVSRYRGQIKFYQIWNEPNVYPEWGEQDISPEGYVELLKVAHARAKRADPDMAIIAAPLAPTIELGPRDMNDFVFLQRMYDAGARDYFDILSVQDYGLWTGPTDKRMRPRVLNFSRPIYIRDMMVQNGDAHKAIWASEISWNAIPKDHPAAPVYGRASDEQVARWMPEAYQRAQEEWPWMGVMAYWFFKRASDAEQDQPWYYFKMLNPDFTPMPVYAALKQYTKQPPAIYPGYFQEDHWAIKVSGEWALTRYPLAILGKYSTGTRPGDSLAFTFVGTGLDLVFVKGPNRGVARISIDERPPIEIDLGVPAASVDQFGDKTQIVRGLSTNRHSARIEVVVAPVGVDGVVVYR